MLPAKQWWTRIFLTRVCQYYWSRNYFNDFLQQDHDQDKIWEISYHNDLDIWQSQYQSNFKRFFMVSEHLIVIGWRHCQTGIVTCTKKSLYAKTLYLFIYSALVTSSIRIWIIFNINWRLHAILNSWIVVCRLLRIKKWRIEEIGRVPIKIEFQSRT